METLVNFRDLGGKPTADGRATPPGQIYRSAQPGDGSEADLRRLTDLGIRTIVDLRGQAEADRCPEPDLPGVICVHLPVAEEGTDTGRVADALRAGDMDVIGAHNLIDANRSMVRKHQSVFAQVVRLIADPENRPVLIHCTAGKDRAGLASAIVLLALGVPQSDVIEDYLYSNVMRSDRNASMEAMVRGLIAERDGVEPESIDLSPLVAMLEVRPEYIQTALDTMIEDHGSVEAFITDGLGLTAEEIARFRDELLEPAGG